MTAEVLPVNVSNTVARVVDDFVADLEATLPDLLDGVYLTGSVALGDVHPPWSDIDFVTVLRERPTADQQRLIADVHERVAQRHPRPVLDGWYLTWEDLSQLPDRHRTLGLRAVGPRVHAGRNWVPPVLIWHELVDHGLHVRGPVLDEAVIPLDPEGVRDWCWTTIDTIWTPWWHRNARLLSVSGLGSLGTWAPASGVLGVARIHYTLTTGLITSKCGAGEWALGAVEPRWRPILQESLRIRNRPQRPSLYRNAMSRRRDALDFMDLLMTQAEEAFPAAT